MPKGYLALVLHAHLPFVRHPEHKDFLEEDWLFQAISETYIPLIQVFDRLMQDGVPFQLTLSLSPPLLSMLSDDLLQQRTVRFLDRSLELAQRNPQATGLEKRALNQAARELLLAQSSDWAFIMFAGTMVDYADKRTQDHIVRFNRLYEEIRKGRINKSWLADIESKDHIFPHIDYRVYS